MIKRAWNFEFCIKTPGKIPVVQIKVSSSTLPISFHYKFFRNIQKPAEQHPKLYELKSAEVIIISMEKEIDIMR